MLNLPTPWAQGVILAFEASSEDFGYWPHPVTVYIRGITKGYI